MERTTAIRCSRAAGSVASPISPVQGVPLPLTIMRWRGGDTELAHLNAEGRFNPKTLVEVLTRYATVPAE